MTFYYIIKQSLLVSVVMLLIFIHICHSTNANIKKEDDEGLIETLDKLIQITEAGRVTPNETKADVDNNVYYLKNSSPRIPKPKSKSKRRSKSKPKTRLSNVNPETTTIKPESEIVNQNETLNEPQDVNKTLEKDNNIDKTMEEPLSREPKIEEKGTSVEKTTPAPDATEIVPVTHHPDIVSARKLLDNGNRTLDATTRQPDLENETSTIDTLNKEENSSENLEGELQDKPDDAVTSDEKINENLESDLQDKRDDAVTKDFFLNQNAENKSQNKPGEALNKKENLYSEMQNKTDGAIPYQENMNENMNNDLKNNSDDAVIKGEKINENLLSDSLERTERPPPSNSDKLPSDGITTPPTTMEKPPVAHQTNPENDITFRKSLNISEPTNNHNGGSFDERHTTTQTPLQGYSPRYLDARIGNLLHDDPDNFIKLLSENANNFKRYLAEIDAPIEIPDLGIDRDLPHTPESEDQKTIKKFLVMKSYNQNHFDTEEEKSLSNEYDTEPSEISFRRFTNAPVTQSNSPYSYNAPVSSTYYVKDNYVPVPVSNTIINRVATLPLANNLQMHYGANALWNNELVGMPRVHKHTHINRLSRLINNLNLVGRVLYPSLVHRYVYL